MVIEELNMNMPHRTCIEELAWFIVKIYCLFLLREFNFVFIQFAFLGGTYLKQMKMKVCC